MRLAARYQDAFIEDADKARPILADLLASVGEGVVVRAPLYVDYGSNITIGDNVWLDGGAIVCPGGTDLPACALVSDRRRQDTVAFDEEGGRDDAAVR
ncbi:hypothetical protein [Streptomyces sp. NPDC058297]|uniref:hypothetical protein n=1 Tax=Streptomyces sp. NPDC058297 TaxID=3346433 RepID=UPI0036E02933